MFNISDVFDKIKKEFSEEPLKPEIPETKSVDFDKYAIFVDGVTSDPSKDYQSFTESLDNLDGEGANIQRLLTAAVGLSAEGGEFMEIVKKMVFQGKPWNDDNREHLIIELGDVMWYVANACIALGVDFDDVVKGNVKKLEKRYPGGSFSVEKSEVRAKGDR